MIDHQYIEAIAKDLAVAPSQILSAIGLFDTGAAIPFVARYRKDQTGNLNEEQLERIVEAHNYFAGLAGRRDAILDAIAKQDQLTDELKQRIMATCDRPTLEELYLPFRKRKRTKATVAHDQGLGPLADYLLNQVQGDQPIDEYIAAFVTPEKNLASTEEAVEGALCILTERIADDADARALLRRRMLAEGRICAYPTKNAENKKTKFEPYYNFSEPASKILPHRFLAISRGVRQGFLRMELAVDDRAALGELAAYYVKEPGSLFEPYILRAVERAYNAHLRPSLENDVVHAVRNRAEEEAVRLFRENTRHVLLAPPAGPIRVIGVQPDKQGACTLAALDEAGAYIESTRIAFDNPTPETLPSPQETLLDFIAKHHARAVAIGNGPGAREATGFVRRAIGKGPDNNIFSVLINESGAALYASSKLAREEFPDLDTPARAAISIARRLQDPLAELVKLEPRNIGVGQHQHDVNQKRLREGLHRTVVSAVNRVGVDLNKASVDLLRYVSGIPHSAARKIVEYRNNHQRFNARAQLLEVEGVGPAVYQQSAGFLRVSDGENPLDATRVHPEAYPVVDRIAETLQIPANELIGNANVLADIDLAQFQSGPVGPLALEDIRKELMRPQRDPRAQFKAPKFREGVNAIEDLEQGMDIEGVVTNVTDFGAFVDVGIQQDGLVHLSELSDRFVRDPRNIVRVGQIVKVKVIRIDKELPRISLSMKALAAQDKPSKKRARSRKPKKHRPEQPDHPAAPAAPEAQTEHKSQPPRSKNQRSRRDDNRDRPRPDHSSRKGPKRPQRPPRKEQGRPPRPEDEAINTQLADQLAALKDKFL